MERENQFIGQSDAFLDAVDRASQAAPMHRPVLVIGERGTGKELIAERLHRLSTRWGEPLVTMNCAALPETLIEAELFGHEAGAFTGATRARTGRFEEADRGTLFLDELATLSMQAQERLLRAVEYGEVTRIGSNRPIRVDVRIVAATNEDLPRLADEGRFRADLLDRLSFEVITLPPLRVREGDVQVLAEFFGRRMASELRWEKWPGFADHVGEQFEKHLWPGNVRELRNVVERAVYRWGNANQPIAHVVFDPFEKSVEAEECSGAVKERQRGRGRAPHCAVRRRLRLDRGSAGRGRGTRTRDRRARARTQSLEPAPDGEGARSHLRPAAPLHQEAWTGRERLKASVARLPFGGLAPIWPFIPTSRG